MDASPGFKLAPSGPIDRVQQRLRMSGEGPQRMVLRAVATALFAWLPLLVASIVAGDSPGVHISFFKDVAVHVRFLLVVPLLLLAEASIGPRSGMVVCEFLSAGLIAEGDRARFASSVGRARGLLDSSVAEVILILATAGLAWVAAGVVANEQTVFWFERTRGAGASATITPAGFWYAFVATPIALYLFLRWLWRYLVWSWFLHRVSRMDLVLSASHPDRMGGLGFVGFHQAVFAMLTFAAGCGASAAAANRILHSGAVLKDHQAAILSFAVMSILVGIAPLLSFTPALVRVKHRGIFEYGRIATDYVQSFERKWLGTKTPRDESLLGSSDIQSLADMGGSFDRASRMSPTLVDRRVIVAFAVASVAPALPLLLTVMPLRDIAGLLMKIVI